MDSPDLHRLLDEARAEGRLDSSGVWRINLYAAARKLGRHLLADPTDSLLKWVQAALAGGASWVDVEIEADHVLVRFDGRTLDLSQLDTLDRWLLDRGRPELHHLAVGLTSAAAHGCDELSVGAHAREVTMTPSAYREVQTVPGPNRIRMGRRRSLAQRLARSEVRRLESRCLYAPVPVLVNGRLVNRPHFGEPTRPALKGDRYDLGPHRARGPESYFGALEFATDLLAAPVLPHTRWWTVANLRGGALLDQPSAAVPGLTTAGAPIWACHAMCRRTHSSWSEAVFVGHGVVLTSERNVLDRPGLLAVISARDLKVDLSGFGVVHDEAYLQTIRTLRERVLWMY